MDIGSDNKYPANKLSNFTRREFVFDGVNISSMEGFLQSLKFENQNAQEITCGLIGKEAKRKGRSRNKRWKSMQRLWWKGVEYKRSSKQYQDLLDRVYLAMFEQNEDFRKCLEAAGTARFTHSIGNSNRKETVLTESEFCNRLTMLRDSRLNNGEMG
ncbi:MULTISPECIES: hypothetical protein [unclassified Methylophaga]|uniref:hypothetical protein n=1 Tax=unclassified Methylophaga TaxID=2629249 RepID=UPI00259C6C71|nr:MULTISPECIES: hypothetical protein [unclassified Methylophaga]